MKLPIGCRGRLMTGLVCLTNSLTLVAHLREISPFTKARRSTVATRMP